MPVVDWWSVGAGLGGAALGAAATLLAVIPQLRREKRTAVAAYQEALAGALFDMAVAFRARQIPHRAGHTCENLLENYEEYLQPYLGEETARTVSRLRELARRARALDGELANELARADDPTELAIELERAAGDLQGKAHQIRVGDQKSSQFGSRGTLTKDSLRTIRISVSVVAAIVAILSLLTVWRLHPAKGLVSAIVVTWTLGPPIWFAFEHILFKTMGGHSSEERADFQAGQSLAGAWWAGVAALLTAIYALQ